MISPEAQSPATTGGKAELPNGQTFDMGEGERFFASPELAGFQRGSFEATVSPWVAACQSQVD